MHEIEPAALHLSLCASCHVLAGQSRPIDYPHAMTHATFDPRSRCLVTSRPRFNWLFVVPALATLVTLGVLETSSASADVRVHDQAEGVQPLSPGTQIPKAVVQTVLGEPMDLEAAIGESGALLVFYRGGW